MKIRALTVLAFFLIPQLAGADLVLERTIAHAVRNPESLEGSMIMLEGSVEELATNFFTLTDGTNSIRVLVDYHPSLVTGDRVRVTGRIIRGIQNRWELDAYGPIEVRAQSSRPIERIGVNTSPTHPASVVASPSLEAKQALLQGRSPTASGYLAIAALLLGLAYLTIRLRSWSLLRLRGIFISYRRGAASAHAGRLAESLRTHLGARVFIDIEGIRPGEDFAARIDDAIRSSSVLLVLIDATWLGHPGDSGRASLPEPRDFIRHEIASALAAGIQIVPVLLDGATMPAEGSLTPDIAPLARHQAMVFRTDDWKYYTEKLCSAISPPLLSGRALSRLSVTAGAAALVLLASVWLLRLDKVITTGRDNSRSASDARAESQGSATPTKAPAGPLFSSGEGTFILTGSEEASYESESLQNGYFTHFLVQGLRQDEAPPTLSEIFEQASRETTAAVARDKNAAQHPQLIPREGANDFRIGVLRRDEAPEDFRTNPALVRRKYALVVGIGTFRPPFASIRFASKDARDFATALVDSRYGRFEEENVRLLTDRQASRKRILEAIHWLSWQVTEKDMVVVFVRSRGSENEGAGGLSKIPYVVTYDSGTKESSTSGIPLKELITEVGQIGCRRKVIVLDLSFSRTGVT